MIMIESDGATILKTNFWETEFSQKGYFYLSPNAGHFRLLVPRGFESILADIGEVRDVVITRMRGDGVTVADDALEIFFDDYTDNPYRLHLTSGAQCSPMPAATDSGRLFELTIWVARGDKPHRAKTYPAKYTLAPSPHG
jgi:hypothetical protein